MKKFCMVVFGSSVRSNDHSFYEALGEYIAGFAGY